jgi:transposase-like protein
MATDRTGRTRGWQRPPPPPAVVTERRDTTASHAILRLIRAARAAAGDSCPRCGSARVHRWGRFGARQRYRCLRCDRTFSDFTATPLAYIKHADRWLAYCTCVAASLSIRASARSTGIHPSTAFRWRHRLFDDLRADRLPRLTGIVEAVELSLDYSEKGARRRRNSRPAHGRTPVLGNRVVALFTCDRNGRTQSLFAGQRPLLAAQLRSVLLPWLAPPCSLLACTGPYSPYSAICDGTAIVFRSTQPRITPQNDASLHVRNAAGLRRRFVLWLNRFRGVATRYLPNYLRWFDFLVAQCRCSIDSVALRLLVRSCRDGSRRLWHLAAA